MAILRAFPYAITLEVVFRDLDALGHVNNAVFLTYLETARIKFLTALLDLKEPRELPVILAEATISYTSPAALGERLAIGVGVSRFGGKSFDMLYQVGGGDGRLVARAKTVQVAYDYAAGASIAIPDRLRQRVHAWQGAWQPPAL